LDTKSLKTAISKTLAAHRTEIAELSRKIYNTPEVGFKEIKASAWLADYLEANGFRVERKFSKMPTAFRAVYGKGKPVIAFLAEYDALPEMGHACGHNLIAGSAIGAGIATKAVVDGTGGTVQVIGTPAEELLGGKVYLAERGAFAGLDAVMMVHPNAYNTATVKFLACQGVKVEFAGLAAHAAARPEVGINALDAVIQSFNAINAMRQHIRSSARIHGIITDGGKAANIVPDHAAANIVVRAEDDEYLDELKSRVMGCFMAAALATGAKVETHWDRVRYAPMRNNMTLARLFKRNLESLGRKVPLHNPAVTFGSSDMGNVSQLVPAIHPAIAIAPEGVALHSEQFKFAAGAQAGICGMMDAAQAMALTAADVLADDNLLKKVRADFERSRKKSPVEEEET